ncbi:MAG TPA: response regulator transcription factor [Candidatus Acidoferrum sp.]|nr:response regulator transcription factor [Candidatus Acidoferrum sp.]
MLVDDHPSLLGTLQHLLRDADDITVVARCESGSEALTAILDRQADVIVLDLRLPVMDGLAVLGTMNERRLGVRVVLLTGAVAESEIPELIRTGTAPTGAGETAPGPLLSNVRTVATHQQRLKRRRTELNGERGMAEDATTSAGLTARELDVVRAVASGLRNRAIAQKLRVTEGTVKVHLHNIYKKLGLDSRLALVIYTKENGLA